MAASAREVRLLNDKTPPFLIDTIHLDVDLADNAIHITSKLKMRRHPKTIKSVTHLVLDGEELTLESVWLNNLKLTSKQYKATKKSLIIYNVPNQFTLLVQTKINPTNSAGDFFTQCETDGLKRITYFLNHPDVMATYTTTITADPRKHPIIFSNGNLIDSNTYSTGRRRVTFEDPVKKPSYLFTLMAGNLDSLVYSDVALLMLTKHGKDPLNRLKASQVYVMNYLLQLINNYHPDDYLAITGAFINHFRSLLTDKQTDSALLASMISMPTEDDIAKQIKKIDAKTICLVRKFVRGEIAHILREELLQKYREHSHLEAAGDRAIKNTCLGFLMELETEEIINIVKAQFDNAKASNVSDAFAALCLLVNIDCRQRDEALVDFYKQWKDNPAVLAKWFTAQAGATSPSALNKIYGLINNPAFDIHNPTMICSLIRPFVQNYSCFHAASGAGYQFLANLILQLDEQNPTLAADFCTYFSAWKNFRNPQRDLMQRHLLRILHQPGLSKNIYEIVCNYLGKAIKKEMVSTVVSTLFNTDDQIEAVEIRTLNEKLSVTM